MDTVMGFPYQKRHRQEFVIAGFTKLVHSGGEQYGEDYDGHGMQFRMPVK